MTNPTATSITTCADLETARGDGTSVVHSAREAVNNVPAADLRQFIEDTIVLWRNQRTTIASNQTHADGQLEREIAGMKLVIESTQEQVANLTRMNENREAIINSQRTAHENDIRIINDRFNSEAKTRGWCDEWENIIQDLNGDLSIELTSRTRSGKVQLEYTVTIIADIADAPNNVGSLADLAYNELNERLFFEGQHDVSELDEGTTIRWKLEDFSMNCRTVLEEG